VYRGEVSGHAVWRVMLWLANVSCSLAYCEIYVMCALMAFKVIPRARLVDTTVEDITYDYDLIVVQTRKGSVSVKIAID
jgi:hypothetical protein